MLHLRILADSIPCIAAKVVDAPTCPPAIARRFHNRQPPQIVHTAYDTLQAQRHRIHTRRSSPHFVSKFKIASSPLRPPPLYFSPAFATN